ncbi:MAG: glycolate oxidase iron-sulfur subunit [Chromatiales bacterium 21-64-14]|nr:MAG: glycolate oxidase iron-sulfur subunit [Chromatiales bacterium 21-64-14]HQU16739.1 glycolate oxidase subunit GlcF [Gammaproteobacteria bacterium]
MQTRLPDALMLTEPGRAADRILRTCVHCGFCNATCPTYQLLGDELDGPRGRIYQIKEMLEGAPVSRHTVTHLDRCLTCRACETTCPSGVQYGRLLDIGRAVLTERGLRPWYQQIQHWGLRRILLPPARFATLLRVGQALRRWLPGTLRARIPQRTPMAAWPTRQHRRRVLFPAGCVQPAAAPGIDAAAARVLDGLGIQTIRAGGGCCGALSHHLGAMEEARVHMRRNIDVWWPYLEAGVEAVVSTASGCGVQIKDYGELLRDDPAYAHRAAQVAAAAQDIGELLAAEDPARLRRAADAPRRIAFHAPCTLQHGHRLTGVVEGLLAGLGFELTPVSEPHLCCGSAGAYSVLQPALAGALRERKLGHLLNGAPELIATANIGCLLHLAATAPAPVRHWVELLDSGSG